MLAPLHLPIWLLPVNPQLSWPGTPVLSVPRSENATLMRKRRRPREKAGLICQSLLGKALAGKPGRAPGGIAEQNKYANLCIQGESSARHETSDSRVRIDVASTPPSLEDTAPGLSEYKVAGMQMTSRSVFLLGVILDGLLFRKPTEKPEHR